MLINGIQSDHIDATDRGLAYGDGLFSTMLVQYGQVELWSYHLQRLQLGAQKLLFPEINWQQLSDEVELIAKSVADKEEYVIKVIITRGSGGRGYSIEGCSSALRIISTAIYPAFYHQWQQQGIELILCESTLSSNTMLAGIKTLNRLEQVLIKNELERKNALEGVVCNDDGYVIEGCTANLFIYLNGCWQTPKLNQCGVAGVQRRNVIECANKAGIDIIETDIHKNELLEAQAIFLTNALMGLVPVKQYLSRKFDIIACEHYQTLLSLTSLGSK